jgi:uncharacterized repeat protein (TIGR01451 family)
MYHDTGYSSANDQVQVQLSTDLTTWTTLGSVSRYSATAGWAQHAVDVSAFIGQPTVYLGLLGVGAYGNDCHIDDVSVMVRPTLAMPIAYNPLTNAVEYTGPLNVSGLGVSTDYGFNAAAIPGDWTVQKLGGGTRTWQTIDAATYPTFVHTGSHAIWHNYEAAAIDDWFTSPKFTVSAISPTATFWATSDTLYPGATVTLWVVKGAVKTQVWDLFTDESWATFEYRQVSIDLSAYVGDEIQLAWQYVGNDGESFGLDDVHLPAMAEFQSVGHVFLTVSVDSGVTAGTYITNTAVMTATHTTPLGLQTDTEDDDAVFHVGLEVLKTSYKEATAEAGAGDTIDYEIHLINSGDKLAENVQLIDPIPYGTSYDDHDPGLGSNSFNYNTSLDQMEWTGSVGPGEELVFYFSVTVDDPPWLTSYITNIATVEWNGSSLDLIAATKVGNVLYLPWVTK